MKEPPENPVENTAVNVREVSPGKKKSSAKIIVVVVAAVVLSLIGLGVWFFGPMRRVAHTEILPPTAFAFFTTDLDPESSGFFDIIERAEKEYLNLEPGTFKARAAMKIITLALPERVTVIITLEDNSTDPGLIFITSMGKMIKFIRLFSSPFDRVIFRGVSFERDHIKGHRFKIIDPIEERGVINSLTNPVVYTFIGNNIVAGTSLPLLKTAYYSYRGAKPSNPMSRSLIYRQMTKTLSPGQNQANITLLVDNNDGKLSEIIGSYEEKYAFAAFPSIDHVTSISGNMSILNEEIDSSFTFLCDRPDMLIDLRSDVKFIYGALRRKLNASGINMKGEVKVEGESVIFNFKITDFIDAVLTPSGS